MKKYYYLLEVIILGIIITVGVYTVSYKLSLTTNAKKDRAIISAVQEQLQKTPTTPLDKVALPDKNEFSGNFSIQKGNFLNGKNHGFTLVSTRVPYQGCLRYGLEAEGLDAMEINGTLIYKSGEGVHRDKILAACLLQPDQSTIKVLIK